MEKNYLKINKKSIIFVLFASILVTGFLFESSIFNYFLDYTSCESSIEEKLKILDEIKQHNDRLFSDLAKLAFAQMVIGGMLGVPASVGASIAISYILICELFF